MRADVPDIHDCHDPVVIRQIWRLQEQKTLFQNPSFVRQSSAGSRRTARSARSSTSGSSWNVGSLPPRLG
jgi:hypothetical protein